jgi:hypothetical protein
VSQHWFQYLFSPQAGFHGWFGHQCACGAGAGRACAVPAVSASPAVASPLASRAPATSRVKVW